MYNRLPLPRVLQIGIFRHIDVFFHSFPETLKALITNDSKVLLSIQRHIINANNPHEALAVLIPKEGMLALCEWFEHLQITNSNIIKHTPDHSYYRTADIIQNLLSRMDSLTVSHEAEEVFGEVMSMMKGITAEIERQNQEIRCCLPILVGSKNEETQCFYPNEYDFFMHLNGYYSDEYFNGSTIVEAVSKIRNSLSARSRLSLDNFAVQLDKRFPCLHCTLTGQHYPFMPISIDIVPVLNPVFVYPSLIPENVIRFKNRLYLDKVKDIQSLIYSNVRSVVNSGAYLVSLIENAIVNMIPDCMRNAYKIAKAVRVSCLLRPIFPQLIALGVTDDIHNIVRTYMLKSCILYLTHNKQHIMNTCTDPICLAIAIYSLLRHCLVIGEFYEYFANGNHVFALFGCEHSVDDSSNRYFCCRQRKARLLIVDRLLMVLREYRDKMHEANGKGCTECANSGDSDYACCADMDFASIRPAPFYYLGYTDEEIERDDAPNLNRDSRYFRSRKS